MTFSDFRSHSNPLFLDLKLLKVRDIIKSQQLKLVYDFCNNILPIDLQNLFKFSVDTQSTNCDLNSARKKLLYIPTTETVTYGDKSLKYHCAKLWNHTFRNDVTIDNKAKNKVSINQIYNVHQFRRVLKKYFLYEYSF